jgi:hypothetical protein
MMETRTVSEESAFESSSSKTIPSFDTGRYVTEKPLFSRERMGERTASCSIAVVIICFPFL